MLRCEVNESLQIRDCAVDEDAFGIVARCVGWEDGIGAGGEDEDIVGDDVPGGCPDGLTVRVDLGDSGVEVVIEPTLLDRSIILFETGLKVYSSRTGL